MARSIVLDAHARIIRHATPLFAKQLSHKYAQMNVNAVCADLSDNHGRPVTASYVQNVTDWVGAIAMAQEETWDYTLPVLDQPVASVAISLDGAMLAMKEEGWREAMVGSLSLAAIDPAGERLHTIYVAATPEHGKAVFLQRMTQEIERIKTQYPNALYLGIADGAASNWSFLSNTPSGNSSTISMPPNTSPAIAMAAYPGKTDKPKREQWLHEQRHQPGQDEHGAVEAVIEAAQRLTHKRSPSKRAASTRICKRP
ncbi:hypothetical protein U5801_21770 [Lamprobacter modestohalophilus]|uniref:hypothetical protein n=1 Tax=Lamprobacter modestohalophilus TaxID=1064514 RepID=UPI002ADEC6BD|nr:hypothetical protein [Lamprobacter modestohalophilus]MEA1052413.1 hypothetical protein [Lamprobacter modestohalophilus]